MHSWRSSSLQGGPPKVARERRRAHVASKRRYVAYKKLLACPKKLATRTLPLCSGLHDLPGWLFSLMRFLVCRPPITAFLIHVPTEPYSLAFQNTAPWGLSDRPTTCSQQARTNLGRYQRNKHLSSVNISLFDVWVLIPVTLLASPLLRLSQRHRPLPLRCQPIHATSEPRIVSFGTGTCCD